MIFSNFLRTLLVLAFAGTLYAAAVPVDTTGNKGRIVGGEETTIAKYPYQVSVRLDTYTFLHICGGSIYAPRVILTAAHCIKGRYPSYIRIVAGESSIADESVQGVRVTKLIYHSGYNKNTHDNDVGLIILTEPLVYTDLIRPIALSNEYPPAGTHATVTGWGKNDEDSATLTNTLQVADVQIVDSVECNTSYETKNYVISEQMVCAGVIGGGTDACQGDSGGPLAVDGELLGVVSWGIGCARSEFPGVYSSTIYHKEWIEEQAAPYL